MEQPLMILNSELITDYKTANTALHWIAEYSPAPSELDRSPLRFAPGGTRR